MDAIVEQTTAHSNVKDEQLKLRNTSRTLVAGMAIAAALTMTACSSDDSDAKSTTSAKATTSASATAAANLPPTPSVADLNAELQKGLDPNVPLDQKVGMIQGAEADPELINRVADAAKQNNIIVSVTAVSLVNDALTAEANFNVNGQNNPATVPFVAEDGKWKIEKSWACNLLATAQVTSPACPA